MLPPTRTGSWFVACCRSHGAIPTPRSKSKRKHQGFSCGRRRIGLPEASFEPLTIIQRKQSPERASTVTIRNSNLHFKTSSCSQQGNCVNVFRLRFESILSRRTEKNVESNGLAFLRGTPTHNALRHCGSKAILSKGAR